MIMLTFVVLLVLVASASRENTLFMNTVLPPGTVRLPILRIAHVVAARLELLLSRRAQGTGFQEH